MITATIRKESKNFKEEIKKIDTTIKENKNKIKSLALVKQKLEREKIKQFVEIKKLNKSMNINEIYQIEKQIQKNNEEIAKLKDKMPTATYSIKRWKGDITILKEAIVAEIVNEDQLDDEIRAIEITGTNLEQKIKNFNDNDLKKKLTLSKLKLKMVKLAIKLEKRTVKTKKIFCKISQNKIAIANKYLLIKQENWHLYPSIKAEKEILDARLNIRLKYKMSNMCDINLNISKRNLKLAKIDKKIARLNVKIDKKNIEIKGCHETIREIYNSQSIKTQIKVLIFKKTLDITFNFKLKVIFLYQRWFFVTNNELIDVLKNKKDEEFIKIIRHFKNRIKQIEKKEKLDAIDKKFKEKGIQCPNCKSYWCVKNGFKNNKQKYLCKDCKSSFDALRNHFLHWSHLSHEQWDWVIWLSLLGQSAYTISQFAKISKTSAWFNRQKFMKSPQLAKTQKSFIKLKGRIEIDETFIKEIHKGNFKNPDDPRKKWIEENAKDLNCCIEMAIDENKNIYAQTTNTKRLTKKWVQENLTSKLIEEKSIIACDMQILYDTVAKQTNCNLQQFKTSTNKELNYKNLSNISKIQSSLKEFITHYHGIGFTNIQNYLNLWKFKYQHYKISPYAKSEALYFSL